MEMLFFESMDEAIRDLRGMDREYVIVDYSLEAGEQIEPDRHAVTEWIILGKGKGIGCRVTIEGKPHEISLSAEKATVVVVPAGKEHFFEALQDLDYTVLRDIP